MKGTRCYGKHDWGARGRVNVIGALIGKALFAVGLFSCNIDTAVFTTWVKYFLLPNLKERTVIVMDNATFCQMSTRFAGRRQLSLPILSQIFLLFHSITFSLQINNC